MRIALAALALALLAGCSTTGTTGDPPAAAAFVAPLLDAELATRIQQLDPDRVSAADVSETLAHAPAAQIMLVHGAVPPAAETLRSFGAFLVAMGYPAERIRNPADGTYTYSAYLGSERLTGSIAWYYEHSPLRPMIVGHSLGGVQTVRVLHELAGEFDAAHEVWNPATGAPESRTTITDPVDGDERPVVGLKLAFASALASGGMARLFPQAWAMAGRLRDIPPSTEAFFGAYIGGDPFGGDFFGVGSTNAYAATAPGVVVETIGLPATYNHFTAPDTAALADDPAARAWIEGYDPANPPPTDDAFTNAHPNIVWAAQMWARIKRHWVLELKRWLATQGQ